MGSNYKAALIPQRIRETIHGWGKAARRKRRLGIYPDDLTVRTDASTVLSVDDDDHQLLGSPRPNDNIHQDVIEIELQPSNIVVSDNENSIRAGSTPLLRPCNTISSRVSSSTLMTEAVARSSSMPARKESEKLTFTEP